MQYKKGQASMMYYIFLIIVLIFVVGTTVTFVYMNINHQVKITEADAYALSNEFLYSRNGITAIDPVTNKQNLFVIDAAKFNDETVDTVTTYGTPENNDRFAALLTITDLEGTELAIATYNKVWYDRWEPLANTGLGGSGSITEFTTKNYILYQTAEEIIPAVLSQKILYQTE